MKRNNKKGFTIVELVIVIAVIAILAGVLIPTFAGIVAKANASKALQEAQNAIKVVAAEYAEDGKAMPNATVYYFEEDAAKGGKVAYTISYTNGKAGEAVDAKGVAFEYTSAIALRAVLWFGTVLIAMYGRPPNFSVKIDFFSMICDLSITTTTGLEFL